MVFVEIVENTEVWCVLLYCSNIELAFVGLLSCHISATQDLYNIEKKEGLEAKRREYTSEPGTTVQAWIEKMQTTEDNPVLLVKYQQEKATEVTLLQSIQGIVNIGSASVI